MYDDTESIYLIRQFRGCARNRRLLAVIGAQNWHSIDRSIAVLILKVSPDRPYLETKLHCGAFTLRTAPGGMPIKDLKPRLETTNIGVFLIIFYYM